MASLIPVLELAPASYATRERDTPSGSIAENPSGWLGYWSASLADAGIQDLKPWAPGSWLVALTQLQHPALLRTVLTHAAPDIATAEIEELGPLSGGYILTHGAVTLLPGCCGDLSNLEEWEHAASSANESWAMLWIGHPWTFIRSVGEELRFVEPSERQDADGLKELLSVSRAALSAAVDRARNARMLFAQQLLPVVEALGPNSAALEVVEVLTRGHDRLGAP